MSMPSSSLASVNMSTPVGPPPVDRQGGWTTLMLKVERGVERVLSKVV